MKLFHQLATKPKHIVKILTLSLLTVSTFQNIQAFAHYNAVPLDNLVSNVRKIKPNSIAFEYKVFDKRNCNKYLGRSEMLFYGCQPIQINIVNNTDRNLAFSLDSFSLTYFSYYTAAKKAQFNTLMRIIDWGLGAILVGSIISMCDDKVRSNKYLDFSLLGIPGRRLFFIPAIVEAIKSPMANKEIMDDYYNKALRNQIIKPHSAVNGIIFIPKNHFDSVFSFFLVDQLTGERFVLSTEEPQRSI